MWREVMHQQWRLISYSYPKPEYAIEDQAQCSPQVVAPTPEGVPSARLKVHMFGNIEHRLQWK